MGRLGKWLAGAALAMLALCFATVVCFGIAQMRTDLAVIPTSVGNSMSEPQAFREARRELRALMKAQLNDVAHDADADPELAEMARRQLVELCAREEQELTLEGVLAMRGWADAVVTVHADSVNVLLQGGVVTSQESASILELVCRETGALSGNVKITPIE